MLCPLVFMIFLLLILVFRIIFSMTFLVFTNIVWL
ncbi:hypothetical protein LINPERPRIM_LOCUS26220 [Linum perenne]